MKIIKKIILSILIFPHILTATIYLSNQSGHDIPVRIACTSGSNWPHWSGAPESTNPTDWATLKNNTYGYHNCQGVTPATVSFGQTHYSPGALLPYETVRVSRFDVTDEGVKGFVLEADGTIRKAIVIPSFSGQPIIQRTNETLNTRWK